MKGTIFLKPTDTVNVDGMVLTVAELKEKIIDSIQYREYLKSVMDDQ